MNLFCYRRVQERLVAADNAGNGVGVGVQRRLAEREIFRLSDRRQVQHRASAGVDVPNDRHLQHEPSQEVVA